MTDMSNPITLPTTPLEHSAMDYAFLRQAGIEHLERMAGHIWTDFNVHDPGITILEQVCYALTDLAYRINYTLPDLLTRDGEEANDTGDTFYSPAQILTTHPVTISDLRKVIIDVAGVKNAWVEKLSGESELATALNSRTEPGPLYFHTAENALSLQGDRLRAEPVYLKGLYRILVELSDLLYAEGAAEQSEARRQIAHRLQANRPLGEDFAEIKILEPEYIQIQARIEIGAVEDAGGLLLAIYRRMADYISPPVQFYTLSQQLEADKRVDEIFAGPSLAHGFIDSEELSRAQRRTALRTSDLIREIMAVPGVRAVRTITLSPEGVPEGEPWSLTLDPNKAPKLSLAASTISLERNQLAVGVDIKKVIAAYEQGLRTATTFRELPPDERDLSPPPGRERHVGHYYSLQHQFPAAYGIGALGLPESASPRRKAQAKQLQAYLLFFDQLLANYFAQLAHLKDLFSVSGANEPTYFAQPITDPSLGVADIFRSDPEAHQDYLQQITENPYAEVTSQPGRRSFPERRHRFLNHLLARFAEQFTDYSLILYDAMGQDGAAAAEKLAQDKAAFLQDYPQLSSARGRAFNYLAPRSRENRSGLEDRLRRKLGVIEPEEDFYLVEHILLRPMTGDQGQQAPILADPQDKDPYSLQISFVFPNWPARFDPHKNPGFRAFIERTIREETPAHLSLTIHWLDRPTMAAFEDAYQDWLEKRRLYWSID